MSVDPNYEILAKDRIVQKIPAKSVTENEIKIYPNPAPDYLNISIVNPTSTQIGLRLYSAAGQLQYEFNKLLSGRDEIFTIPVSQLSRGAYILYMTDSKTLNIKKLIIR